MKKALRFGLGAAMLLATVVMAADPLPPKPVFKPPFELPGGNVLPGVLRLKSVSYTSLSKNNAVVPFSNINLTIVIHNFLERPGTRIQHRIIAPNFADGGRNTCTMTKNPRSGVSESSVIDQNGELRIGVTGWFTSAGKCAVGVEMTVPSKAEPVRFLVETPVNAPTSYTLNQTGTLRKTLAFRAGTGLGTCDGTSIGPSNYSVGVLDNTSDLTLRIRSGPLGTECQYISKPWVLPDGVRLISTTWEGVREIPEGQTDGRCCVVNAFGHNCITMPPHAGENLNFTRGTKPIVTGQHSESTGGSYSVTSADSQILIDGVIVHENSTPRVITVLKPMWGKLQCTNTGWNDHGVRLILRDLVLDGPPSLTFP